MHFASSPPISHGSAEFRNRCHAGGQINFLYPHLYQFLERLNLRLLLNVLSLAPRVADQA